MLIKITIDYLVWNVLDQTLYSQSTAQNADYVKQSTNFILIHVPGISIIL